MIPKAKEIDNQWGRSK